MAARHEHLIDLMPDFNWALHHHDACRSDLDRCPVTIAVRRADVFPDHIPGTYACHVNADGELELRTVAPRLTERQIGEKLDAMAARVAELERQSAEVLALCDRLGYYDGPTLVVDVDKVRAIYGGES